MNKLTHFNADGFAHMVDVGDKPFTQRIAIAEGFIEMKAETLMAILAGNHKKGDVLGIARIAGIMASKRTSDLIPLCHTVLINHADVKFESEIDLNRLRCEVTVKTNSQTGVEMEALTAVQIALLTVYDMCKAIDRGMTINSIRLLEKSGGKSGLWFRET